MQLDTIAAIIIGAVVGVSAVAVDTAKHVARSGENTFVFDIWANQNLITDPAGSGGVDQHQQPCFVPRLQDTTTGEVLFGPAGTSDSETNCATFGSEPDWTILSVDWTKVSCDSPQDEGFGWSWCVQNGNHVVVPPLVSNSGTAQCDISIVSGDATVGHASCTLVFE